MLFRASIGVFSRSDLLVRSRVGSACQIRFKSNLWFRSYLVGYAVQTILGQICWSDQLVRSGKSDLWFTSCLVGSVVQIIYWVRSAGQIKSPSVRVACLIRVSRTCGSDHIWLDRLFRSYIGSGLLVRSVFHQVRWRAHSRSDLLVSSLCVGSACQIRLSRICGLNFGRLCCSVHIGSDRSACRIK